MTTITAGRIYIFHPAVMLTLFKKGMMRLDLTNVPWRRMNPKKHNKIRMTLMKRLFDGDHAAASNFVARKSWTLNEVMESMEELEKQTIEEEQYATELEKFKIMASNGEININLKDISKELFYDSEDLNEFWRVSFELHNMQHQN